MIDPKTRPLLFDSHAHLVADDQQAYPRNPMTRSASAPPRLPGVIGLPGGAHGPNPINEVPDVSRMLDWMAEENVDGIVAVQKRMIYRYDNSYILDSVDAHPDLMAAVVILDAEHPDTPGEVERLIRDRGLVGLRLFGGRDAGGGMLWLNSAAALRSWAVVNAAGIVMDVEVLSRGGGGPSAPALLELARSYPNTRLVLDHMLEPEVDHAEFGLDHYYRSLIGQPNIFFKFTSINLDICRETGVSAVDFLRRCVDMFGADHVMWGSDIGTSSGTYKDMVQRAVDATAALSDGERRMVLHDTGRAVFLGHRA